MSATHIPVTEFAPAERLPIAIVHRQASDVATLPLTSQLLNSVLSYVLILNGQRQIVFVSDNVLWLTPGKQREDLLGLRPGEALGCIHGAEQDGGCGTTLFCRECGAVKAILASQEGCSNLQECRLLRVTNGKPEALDLLVHASPLAHNGDVYTLFCLSDISHLKRRHALERIFFHDLTNAIGGLEGLIEQLRDAAPALLRPDLQQAEDACRDLLEQILAQKDLVQAEQSELAVTPVPANAALLMGQVLELFRHHPTAQDRQLVLGPSAIAAALVTDVTLLKRVLGNLLKNALEATPPGGRVTLACAVENAGVRFSVHNPGVIPGDIQRQIFNRSFSTKGEGRGLGTYSVKLLVERYLQGTVEFTSLPDAGTTFLVRLPRRIGD